MKRLYVVAFLVFHNTHMLDTILGKKQEQTQKFLDDGTRIPVTVIYTPANPVVSVKTKDKAGYNAVQLGFGIKKHPNKALSGHIKGADLKAAPQYLREVRVSEEDAEKMPKAGESVSVPDVFKAGDIVDVIGVSKGKGYAGGVKRHHFKGGPRTHGQSDRERAPGSIGQTTTPGRVYKGKRMAGHMGVDNVTVKNLRVVDVTEDMLFIKGLVPGSLNSLVIIKKVGEGKKPVSLYKEEVKESEKPAAEEIQKENEAQKEELVETTETKKVSEEVKQEEPVKEEEEVKTGEKEQKESEK